MEDKNVDKVKRKPLLLKDVVMILIKVLCGMTIRQDQNVTANFTLGGWNTQPESEF